MIELTSKTVWSLECLALEHELAMRYRMMMYFLKESPVANTENFEHTYETAIKHLHNLEDHFFSQKRSDTDILWLTTLAGWVGPQNPDTPKILDSVRSGLLDIYSEVRDHNLHAPADREWVAVVKSRVDEQIDKLFKITGPDEDTWQLVIAQFYEAGKMIKNRAIEFSKS